MSTKTLEEKLTKALKEDLYVSDTSVADILIENGTISVDAWQKIHKEPSNERKVKCLVRYLSTRESPFEAFEQLVEALKSYHNHLVIPSKKIIEDFKQRQAKNDSSSQNVYPARFFGKVCKNSIIQNKLILTTLQKELKDLHVHDCGLVDGLIAFGIVSTSDWEIISGAKRNRRKIKKLIQCILRSQDPCYGLQKFRDFLAISHEHLQSKVDNLLHTFQCPFDRMYSASSSESEVMSEATPSDLEPSEVYIFETLISQHGYTSEEIDNMIENGYLTPDDYNAVHDAKTDRHRAAVLTKLLMHKYNSMTECHRASGECNVESGVVQFQLPPIGIPNKKQIRNLQVVYDNLNDRLNKGTLDIEKCLGQYTEVTENNDIQCIIYYFAAMEIIFSGNFDNAETVVEKIDNLIEHSSNSIYLRGEVMSAKSWLLLKTNRLGLLEAFLQENLQLVQTSPNIWSPTAMGWLYYELGRCNLAKLELILFRSVGRKYSDLKWSRAQDECIQSAKRYIYRAREHFKMSETSDGPLGLGFCNCLLVELLLKCGEKFRLIELECSANDIREAEEILDYMSKDTESIPPTLETDFLLCQCDLQYRKGNCSIALQMAEKCFKRSEELQLVEELENAFHRMKRLEICMQ